MRTTALPRAVELHRYAPDGQLQLTQTLPLAVSDTLDNLNVQVAQHPSGELFLRLHAPSSNLPIRTYWIDAATLELRRAGPDHAYYYALEQAFVYCFFSSTQLPIRFIGDRLWAYGLQLEQWRTPEADVIRYPFDIFDCGKIYLPHPAGEGYATYGRSPSNHWLVRGYGSEQAQLDSHIREADPELLAYPNPTDRLLNVRFRTDDYRGRVFLQLVDVAGRVVQEETLQAQEEVLNAALDVKALPAGMYYLRVRTAETTRAVPVVVR